MADFKIRKAALQDIPAIRAMADVVFRLTYKDILSPAQMEYMMDMMYSVSSLERQMTVQRNTFFLADGMGYVSFRPDGSDADGTAVFHLEKLYVMPDCQKTGLGRVLFDTVVSEVRKELEKMGGKTGKLKGRLELNVNRNNQAIGFYEHIGMYKARQGDFPIGDGFYMNDYIMALDL